ncbi:DsbA family oxidoreductase [Pseudoalteromonas xiamenensis]
MKNLKIEYVHDIDCSWCPINYANLKTAIKALNDEVSVEIEFLPYEVKPNFKVEGEKISTHLMKLNGWNEQQHAEYRESLLRTAAQAGVKIDFSKRTHYYNTSLGHRLVHFASLSNKQAAMNELLIEGYFEKGLNPTKVDQLLELAARLDLDLGEAKQVLTAQFQEPALVEKYQRARQITTRGVPALRINGKQVVIGTRPPEYFIDLLRNIET